MIRKPFFNATLATGFALVCALPAASLNAQRYLQNGAEPAPSTPEEFHKVQQAEFARVKKIVQDLGIKPQF